MCPVSSAQVVFSLKFYPHVLAALSVLNAHFSPFSPLRLPFFFLGSIYLHYNLENALRGKEKSQNK